MPHVAGTVGAFVRIQTTVTSAACLASTDFHRQLVAAECLFAFTLDGSALIGQGFHTLLKMWKYFGSVFGNEPLSFML